MSWQSKLLSLLSGITDPSERLDIARTVFFLLQMYDEGRIGEDELRQELTSIFKDVISMKHPELDEEEVDNKARYFAEAIIRSYRASTSFRRVSRRLGARL